jgi:hypothetical protein
VAVPAGVGQILQPHHGLHKVIYQSNSKLSRLVHVPVYRNVDNCTRKGHCGMNEETRPAKEKSLLDPYPTAYDYITSLDDLSLPSFLLFLKHRVVLTYTTLRRSIA